MEILNRYINDRLQKIQKENVVREEELRLSKTLSSDSIQHVIEATKIISKKEQTKYNRWSFGILYVPYYSGTIYTIIQGSSYSYPNIYNTSNNETNMEAQFTFAVANECKLTFDVGYISTYYETREENHSRSNSGYNYDSGTLDKNDLSIFDFSIGVKYYFKNIITDKVGIYALFGLGKQFASADEEHKSLFVDQQPSVINQNNAKEYMEDLNSPFHYNIGFGAEYFFNESLSLTSNIRFIYSKISAKYDSRSISIDQTNTNTTDYKKTNFITRVGLGLNFYF